MLKMDSDDIDHTDEIVFCVDSYDWLPRFILNLKLKSIEKKYRLKLDRLLSEIKRIDNEIAEAKKRLNKLNH